MVKVAEKEYPKGSYPGQQSDGFYLHAYLKQQLDYYIKNVINDWDFTIIVSGGGGVRLGKSILAMTIGAYWTSEIRKKGYNVPFSTNENFVFDGQKLIETGNNLGQKHPYSCIIYDEAGADLEGVKAMKSTTQAVKDYLRECGQYNMLTILVLPEYFDLPKGIAVNRTNCLLDVYYIPDENGIFQRGYFGFFGKKRKKNLYLKGKRNLDYKAEKPNFLGDFINFYPIDEKEYKRMKIEALKKRESNTVDKKMHQRNIAWHILVNEFGMTQQELARRTTEMGAYTIKQTISEALKGLGLSGAID